MDASTTQELQRLRARAYGPAADIDRDPEALRRLHELEELLAPGPADEVAEALPEAPDTARFLGRDVPVDPPVDEPAAAPEPETEPPPGRPRRRIPRLIAALWIASIVAAGAAGGAIAYGLVAFAPVSISSGAPQIATLRPDANIQVPRGWMSAGASSDAYEFHGLTLIETEYGYAGPGQDCLTIVHTDEIPEDFALGDSWTTSGVTPSGCGMGAFPATVEYPVDSNSPRELRAEYPGAVLQFVRNGEDVGVFLDSE